MLFDFILGKFSSDLAMDLGTANTLVYMKGKGIGCPYCATKIPSHEYNLKAVNPNLAKEWHPTLNGTLKPQDVLPGSQKKVWWQCSSGHAWKASIGNRHRLNRGCPYCGGQKVQPETSLAARFPAIAAEWHPYRNDASADKVFPGTHIKAWWMCSKGHEWQARVGNRVSLGYGCPHCKKILKRQNKKQ